MSPLGCIQNVNIIWKFYVNFQEDTAVSPPNISAMYNEDWAKCPLDTNSADDLLKYICENWELPNDIAMHTLSMQGLQTQEV